MTRQRIFIIALLLWVPGLAGANTVFPQPPELQPDVDFWVAIFSQYSTDEGVLHDSRNLAVVYARLDVPSNLSRRERNRRIDTRRKEIRGILRSLASGKRENLSAEEQRVLGLWPAGVSNLSLIHI